MLFTKASSFLILTNRQVLIREVSLIFPHSITNSKDRGSQVSQEGKLLLDTFVQQLEEVFKKLPKPLEWRSFYRHDLNLIVDTAQEVRKVSIQHKLNTGRGVKSTFDPWVIYSLLSQYFFKTLYLYSYTSVFS